MLLEPANAVTDLVLTLVALALAWRSWSSGVRERYWFAAFASAGIGALLGTLYHGGLKANATWGFPTWTVITLCVAATVSFLLAGTVALLVGGRQARLWLWLRMGGLGAFGVVALTGHAGLGTLLLTESLTMAAILGLWWRAWRRGTPGATTVLLAMGASALGGLLRVMPLTLHLGWTFTGTALYHLAQTPGLVLLAHGVSRGAAAAADGQPTPTGDRTAAVTADPTRVRPLAEPGG